MQLKPKLRTNGKCLHLWTAVWVESSDYSFISQSEYEGCSKCGRVRLKDIQCDSKGEYHCEDLTCGCNLIPKNP